jgi:hypothetical protein
MNVERVVQRALSDPMFEAELKQAALRLAKDGVDSEALPAILFHFADGPEELARLNANLQDSAGVSPLTTMTTTTTVTTAACLTTMTTTTTSNFCPFQETKPQSLES